MYTIVFAMTLLVSSAEGNNKAEEKSVSENFVVLNSQSEIRIDRTFYHFNKEKADIVQKDRTPMMVCSYVGDEIKCEKKISQLIDMPLLNFWSLYTKK